mgnify:CR=1 FL=1
MLLPLARVGSDSEDEHAVLCGSGGDQIMVLQLPAFAAEYSGRDKECIVALALAKELQAVCTGCGGLGGATGLDAC